MTTDARRKRPWAALGGAALVLSSTGAVAATTQTAVAADPVGDCAAPFPVADLETGDEVTGLTVAKGTTPADFTGEVLGVLEDGIAPGLDMVIVDLTSPDIDRVGSIWAGMSGSPVYAADGRLIGAVSYAMSWGPSQVAGVTPFEDMDDYLTADGTRATVRLPKAEARTVARAAGVSVSRASSGLKRLSVPMTVGGFDPARVQKVAGKGSWLRNVQGGPTGRAASAGPETIVAGGNLGGSVSHGMITYSGVGTATSVCDGEVVGFGHPLGYLGSTTVAMHPASAVYVQEDPAGTASKFANLGAPVGTITDDRLAGISGRFGAVPSGAVLSSTARLGARSFQGSTTVTVQDYLGDVAWYHVAGVNDRTIDGYATGSALISWTVRGKDAQGAPFTLSMTDRNRASWDLASEAPGLLPELVWSLSGLEGVTVDQVTSDTTLSTDSTRDRVAGVQRLVKGRWVDVSGAVKVKAGKKLKLRAVLHSSKGTSYRSITVPTKKRYRGLRAPLFVVGGERVGGQGGWGSLSGLKKYVATKARNDQVVAVLGRPSRRDDSALQFRSAPGQRVVTGQQRLRIVVK